MRFASIFVLLGSVAVMASSEEAKVPYTAFVLSDDAPVRSGPAKVHYPSRCLTTSLCIDLVSHFLVGTVAFLPLDLM